MIMLGDFLKGGSQIAGSLTQANAISGQDNYQQSVFNFNSAMATIKANEAIQTGQLEEEGALNRSSQLIGREKTAYAGAGIVANTGTAQEAQDQTGAVGAHDALMARINAERMVTGYETQVIQDNSDSAFSNLANKNNSRNTIFSGIEGGLGEVSQGFKSQFPPMPETQKVGQLIDWGAIHGSLGTSFTPLSPVV